MFDAAQMADELSERERALRRLPLPYSLALRLRDAGLAAELICLYVNLEQTALDGFYRIAEAKLVAAQDIYVQTPDAAARRVCDQTTGEPQGVRV
jgi:hypothetical protein